MRIRSKVILFSLFFALASGAVMAWCYINIRQEEAATLAQAIEEAGASRGHGEKGLVPACLERLAQGQALGDVR